MRKMRLKLILVLFVLVLFASVLAVVFSAIISNLAFGGTAAMRQIGFGMALREMLTVILIVSLTALFISINSKRIVAPVVRLSEETKRIAKGEFETEIQISCRHDEIGELERNFAAMVKELRSIELMRKDFIANLSHDIKTPLSIIQGYADALVNANASPEDQAQYAATIKQETEHLIALTSNMLRLSKLSSQNIQPVKNRFRLDEQIRLSMLTLEPKWSRRDIQFDAELPKQEFVGDEELLSQVWLNLLDNAIKFSHDGGTVKIDIEKSDGSICIIVTDYGIGISDEVKNHIFDQFYQGDSSRSNDGSGLGLSIVKRIVELHGGTIEVYGHPGQGASFQVVLPLHTDSV